MVSDFKKMNGNVKGLPLSRPRDSYRLILFKELSESDFKLGIKTGKNPRLGTLSMSEKGDIVGLLSKGFVCLKKSLKN